MNLSGLAKSDYRKLVAALALILFWLLTPLIMQQKTDFSAVEISFGITVLYYLGFRMWKRRKG